MAGLPLEAAILEKLWQPSLLLNMAAEMHQPIHFSAALFAFSIASCRVSIPATKLMIKNGF